MRADLLHRDGLLHCRGVIEKYETENYCYMLNRSNRKDKWLYLLNNRNDLCQEIQNCIGVYSVDQIASSIVELYSDLSIKRHNPQLGPKFLKICGNITVESAQIIACICNKLDIKWDSDLIDQNLQALKKE